MSTLPNNHNRDLKKIIYPTESKDNDFFRDIPEPSEKFC
jgi:hypothetical protein